MEWTRRSFRPFPAASSNISRRNPPFNRLYGEIYPFLAWRNGKPVGRIAAIVNRAHNERYGDRTGFFGFFDCEDNIGLARLLFDAAGRGPSLARTGIASAVPTIPASMTNAVFLCKASNIPVSWACLEP